MIKSKGKRLSLNKKKSSLLNFSYIRECLEKFGYYNLVVVGIIVASFILRFYNFPSRWGLGADDARDALTALDALRRHSIPLMGSFSSAGPFVIGGSQYWFIMLSYAFFPFLMSAPWIFTGLVGVATVYLFIKLGEQLGGKKFGIILGILSATSPQFVLQSITLSNTTFVYTFSALLLYCFLLLWNRRRNIYAFLAGIALGFAISFHYSALNLLIFLPLVFLTPKVTVKNKLIFFLTMVAGFLIPSAPILFWDSQQNFSNTRNIMDYFLFGQFRIYVPNSWRLFIFSYMPFFWKYAVGTYYPTALILFFLSSFTFIYAAITKKISSGFILIGLVFYILLIVNKYYKGERFEGYMLYIAPFILVVSGLIFYLCLNYKNRVINFLGIVAILLIIVLNYTGFYGSYGYKNQLGKLSSISNMLSYKFPGQKFAIYDFKYMKADTSVPLSLILEYQNKSDSNGIPIGFVCNGCKLGVRYKRLFYPGVNIADLRQFKNSNLNRKSKVWTQVNKENLYNSQIGWLSQHNLKSTFSLSDYIFNKLKGK